MPTLSITLTQEQHDHIQRAAQSLGVGVGVGVEDYLLRMAISEPTLNPDTMSDESIEAAQQFFQQRVSETDKGLFSTKTVSQIKEEVLI